jgi:hypothetical protein
MNFKIYFPTLLKKNKTPRHTSRHKMTEKLNNDNGLQTRWTRTPAGNMRLASCGVKWLNSSSVFQLEFCGRLTVLSSEIPHERQAQNRCVQYARTMQTTEKVKINSTAITSIVAFGLFILSLIINFYRQELFGFHPRVAGHNFAFNLTFFIPINLIVLILCLTVITKTIVGWKTKENKKAKIIGLSLTIPIVILWTLQIIKTLII